MILYPVWTMAKEKYSWTRSSHERALNGLDDNVAVLHPTWCQWRQRQAHVWLLLHRDCNLDVAKPIQGTKIESYLGRLPTSRKIYWKSQYPEMFAPMVPKFSFWIFFVYHVRLGVVPLQINPWRSRGGWATCFDTIHHLIDTNTSKWFHLCRWLGHDNVLSKFPAAEIAHCPVLAFDTAMQTRSKCSSIVKLTRGAIQNFRSGQKQSFPKTMSKVVFDSQGVTLAWKKRPTITQYLNWRNIAFTQRALSHEDCIDLEPFQTAVVPHCAGSAFCLHNRFGNEHNTSHLSAQLGVSYCRGGQWGLISICFQLRDTENGQWCHASNRQNLWHFLAREIWFVNAGQLASRVACQEVPHLWLDCILIMFDHFWSVGFVGLFLSWKFPSSHTIQTARYIRNPHSAKTMSNNFARLWG